jgi:hypothetical protein
MSVTSKYNEKDKSQKSCPNTTLDIKPKKRIIFTENTEEASYRGQVLFKGYFK